MKMAKKSPKVVVSAAYLNVLEGKAALLDDMFDRAFDGVAVQSNDFKRHAKLSKAADKVDNDSVTSYEMYVKICEAQTSKQKA